MSQSQTPFVPKWDVSTTDGLFYQDKNWVLVQETPTGLRLALYDDRETEVEFSHEAFERLRGEGKLTIRRHQYLSADAPIEYVTAGQWSLGDLSSEEQRILFFRVDICERVIAGLEAKALSLSVKRLRPFLETFYASWVLDDIKRQTIDGRHGSKCIPETLICPSPRTVTRWVSMYREADRNPISLLKQYGKSGNRSSKVSSYVRGVVDRHAKSHASRLQQTIASTHKNLVREISARNRKATNKWEARPVGPRPVLERVPCIGTLSKAIERINEARMRAGRKGADAAAKELAIQHGGLGELRLMQRVEMDDWEIPLQTLLQNAGVWAKLPKSHQRTVERIKVKALTAIECSSRICLAAKVVMIATGPAAVEMLNMTASDKTDLAKMAGCAMPWDQFGLAETYSSDNGVYKEPCVRAALADLRVVHHLMPTGSPSARGKQERLYRRLADELISSFSGRTFANPIVRGDYDSAGNAVIDIEELGRILIRFIVDVYHITPHKGLGGRTPLDVWNEKRKIQKIFPPPDADQRRHIFGVPVERKITNYGIRFLGLNYQSEALQRLRSFPDRYRRKMPGGRTRRAALIRIDPLNLGAISVGTVDGWITVPCELAGMENVPVLQWQLACEKIRRDNLDQSIMYEQVVMDALEKIQDFADKALIRANITSPILSQKAFDKLERELFAGFSVARHDNPNADALDFIAPSSSTSGDKDDHTTGNDLDPLFGFEG